MKKLLIALLALTALPQVTSQANHRPLYREPLYGVTFFRNELIRIDPGTGASKTVANLTVPVSGYGLASRYGRLYSFNPMAGEVVEINPLTGEVGQTISVGLTNVLGEGDFAFRSDGMAFLATTLDSSGNTNAQLFRIDVLAGTSQRVGDTSLPIDALAFDADDNLYAIAQARGTLYRINQTNGAATEVGSLGFSGNSPFAGMSFAPDGSLYAAIDDQLVEINPTNGVAFAVSTNVFDYGHSSVSGLAFQTGQPDEELLGISFFSGQLVRIDPIDGSAMLVGTNTAGTGASQTKLSGIGLAAFDGRLYTFDAASGRIYEIDPGSGAATKTNEVPQISGLQGEGDIAIRADGVGLISTTLTASGETNNALISFNLTNGSSQVIGNTAVPIDALAFSPAGVLYALGQAQGKLYTVNQTNAALTVVGTSLGVPMNSPFAALTFTPEDRLVAAIDDRLYSIDVMSGVATATDTNVLDIGYSSISGLAVVPVRRLGITQEASRLVVFSNGVDARLQSASVVTGPYADVENQQNPLVLSNTTMNAFFRLRRP